jgi:phosphatidylinositol-3-phosphatase
MTIPNVSHVTLVVMENRNYASIVGNRDAPYFNKVLVPQSVLLANSHAVAHPSEPNYLALFSGSTHGVVSDACPTAFSSPNLASELAETGRRFVGWAESMPADGFAGCYSDGLYARKHDPWVDFTNVPGAVNRVYHGLPVTPMPAVSWVTPNLCNDMHDCSASRGDAWLSANLPPIIAWNAHHDGVLIVTWDEAEPDADGTNHIPTVLVGPMLKAGFIDRRPVDHYAVLRTIEASFGLPCIASECQSSVLEGIWR